MSSYTFSFATLLATLQTLDLGKIFFTHNISIITEINSEKYELATYFSVVIWKFREEYNQNNSPLCFTYLEIQ